MNALVPWSRMYTLVAWGDSELMQNKSCRIMGATGTGAFTLPVTCIRSEFNFFLYPCGREINGEHTLGPQTLAHVCGIQFINLLTNDDKIRIGHNQQSETFGIQTAQYIDPKTGHSVTLIDTPGFDDSREGVTDTDILEKIVQFLEPGGG